jgi:hypothetical protein
MPGSGTAGTSMTVNGNLSFAGTSATYMVQISPTTASVANVIGTASLNNATVQAVFAAGSYIWRTATSSCTPPAASAAPCSPA